jgi:hypothetical protein
MSKNTRQFNDIPSSKTFDKQGFLIIRGSWTLWHDLWVFDILYVDIRQLKLQCNEKILLYEVLNFYALCAENE